MKKASLFLQTLTVLKGLFILLLAIFAFQPMAMSMADEFPQVAPWHYVVMFSMYLGSAGILFALYHFFKLFGYMGDGTFFSEKSLKTLSGIKKGMVAFGVFAAFCLPAVFIAADVSDAPGAIFMGAVPMLAAFTMFVFVGMVQKLIKDVINK